MPEEPISEQIILVEGDVYFAFEDLGHGQKFGVIWSDKSSWRVFFTEENYVLFRYEIAQNKFSAPLQFICSVLNAALISGWEEGDPQLKLYEQTHELPNLILRLMVDNKEKI
ncbi:hypothetical protein HYT84_00410, partial [Candidatus Micrarchaeota archaeon]|nr:hypothetical protein [Candidatus Micrarchaeota archaeon]